MTSALTAAVDYQNRGWCPIPIPARAKAPTMPGWQKLRPVQEDLGRLFRGQTNIGIVLGAPSGGLVDIDLDCPETVAMADDLLPVTPATFGRASKPRSHRLYRCPDARTRKFPDPVNGAMLVEIRGDGGLQTVFPPSVHPSGEAVAWEGEGDPAEIAAADLSAAVGRLAAAALIARHVPDGASLVRSTPPRRLAGAGGRSQGKGGDGEMAGAAAGPVPPRPAGPANRA
jgi:putative DNA primase/helicase